MLDKIIVTAVGKDHPPGNRIFEGDVNLPGAPITTLVVKGTQYVIVDAAFDLTSGATIFVVREKVMK